MSGKSAREARDSVARRLQENNGGRGSFADYQKRVQAAMQKGDAKRRERGED